jgi:hypothetical protein
MKARAKTQRRKDTAPSVSLSTLAAGHQTDQPKDRRTYEYVNGISG